MRIQKMIYVIFHIGQNCNVVCETDTKEWDYREIPNSSVETDELHLAQFETFVDEVLDELMKCVLIRQL